MAKNWKVGEAVRAIMAGNKEDILDIGRRFPLFLNLASQINEAGAKILDCIPDYVTARKIESVLKGEITTSEGEEDAGDAGEEKTEKAESKKETAKESKDTGKNDEYTGKSPKELYELCKSRELKVEIKQPAEVYIKALKADDAKKAKAAAAKKEIKKDDDDWGDEGVQEEKKGTKKGKKEEKKEDDDWDI